MNQLSAIAMPRAVRLGKVFTMWTLDPEGRPSPACPIEAATLEEAVRRSTPSQMRLDLARGGFPGFVILETDDRARTGKARQVVHFYTVKVSRVWRAIGTPAVTRKVAVPCAVHQGSLPMNSFDPRRPFSALTDCPVTGRQPGEQTVVELRP